MFHLMNALRSTAKLTSFDKEMKFEIGDTDYNTELGQQSGQWGEG